MSDPDNKTYQIKLKGHLSESWANWFEGLTFTHRSDGTTTLTGEIMDQAALYGLLKKIRDLMPLLSINQLDNNGMLTSQDEKSWNDNSEKQEHQKI